ncbi:hypothetical protein LX81_04235 [Palleronia aestuarii]|uniref:Uncharacterized protein n=1 Tax=Palleronia aestuarii TaxID=568105 RepID=A0A2W7N0H1_9RHOB|nr:hypothetical protein [Palleronia aestuarii]PZX10354.1 hypothetical protein LX81_04235 [Palleronia aestuarii]
MFAFATSSGEMEALRERFLGVSEEVTAALYVRSPAPYYLSALQQCVRSGAIPAPHPFQFRATIKALERTFGNPVVRAFERESLLDGDIVSDFFSAVIGDPDIDCNFKTVSLNESVSAEATSIILDYRHARLPHRTGITDPLCNLLWIGYARSSAPMVDPDVHGCAPL